jgi:hypothetical protein
VTYYEKKEKHDNLNELQTVKESLLEENEKIKRFKEALKEKLIIYQQRIQFLKVSSTTFDRILISAIEKISFE